MQELLATTEDTSPAQVKFGHLKGTKRREKEMRGLKKKRAVLMLVDEKRVGSFISA